MERGRFERLHEAVRVPDSDSVAFPELLVPTAAEAHRPGVAHSRVLAAHLVAGLIHAEVGGREDVAAVILALDRNPPAPAGVHRLRRRIRLDRAPLRHLGNDRRVAEETRCVADERRAERLLDHERPETARIDVQVGTQLASVVEDQPVHTFAIGGRYDGFDFRVDVPDAGSLCALLEMRDE